MNTIHLLALLLWFLPTFLHIVTLFNRGLAWERKIICSQTLLLTHHDTMLVRDVMAQVFFGLLQPDQLKRPLEVITTAHSTLDHSSLLGQRIGSLKAKLPLNLFRLDLLQRGGMPLLPTLSLPLFHLFRGAVVVTNLFIPKAYRLHQRRAMHFSYKEAYFCKTPRAHSLC